MNKKELILDTLSDLVSNFLYYDRKEDEELAVGEIEQAIHDDEITIEEMVEHFKDCLLEHGL